MIGAVLQPVARTAVARCRAHRDALRGGRLQHAVERLRGLRLPDRFRAAPTDRDHRRLVGRVVDGRVDGLDEARVAVRREVHGFAAGAIAPAISMSSATSPSGPLGSPVGVLRPVPTFTSTSVGGVVMPASEILLDVGRAVAAAELDDRDALPGAVAGREAVQRGQLDRGERYARRARANGGRSRKCGRACGRLSRPSTAVTASPRSSAARSGRNGRDTGRSTDARSARA